MSFPWLNNTCGNIVPIFCAQSLLVSDMGRLQHESNLLQLLATCSIMITNKQNHNVIDYDYIESYHDYNFDYICLETFSEWKQTPFV